MNGRNAPSSPVSLGGSEWSYTAPVDKEGPLPISRGQLMSPPDSAGLIASMNGSFLPGAPSMDAPSPPPSVGRSSVGTYAMSESGRSQKEENTEAILAGHYVSLKRFLSATSRDGKPNPPPNKARDKLLRLTRVQFLELSTDVYDELKRREAVVRRPPNSSIQGAPPYLLPEPNFYSKRNQARQKLSSLPPPRFRDLATDVFCELERRYPRFPAGDLPPPRPVSNASARGPHDRSHTPVSGMNGFPPRTQSSMRRPSEASSIMSGRSGLMGGAYGIPPSPGLPNGDFARPMAKQSQSNTIVPNKSTMVEEDDEPGSPVSSRNDDVEAVLDQVASDRDSKRSGATDRSHMQSEVDKKMIEDYEAQVRDLRERLDSVEGALKRKEEELSSARDTERSLATTADRDQKEWGDTRADLESRLAEAQTLGDSLRQELDRIRDDHASEIQGLKDGHVGELQELEESHAGEVRQLGDAHAAEVRQLRDEHANEMLLVREEAPPRDGRADEELQRENEELRVSLRKQQQVTEQVRHEAQEFLREMKMISDQSGSVWEKQGELEKTIERLEKEVREWRNRYARAKTQLRSMRTLSLAALPVEDAARHMREQGFVHDEGLVRDVHVTKFQISIDELLRSARTDGPDKVMDSMKAAVVSVRRIVKDMDVSSAAGHEGAAKQQAKLRSHVSSTANNLITASKNFAASAGISPVSLLDAAASHLVAAVVELLRAVKVKPTPAEELDDNDDDNDDDGTVTSVGSLALFSPRSNGRSRAAAADPAHAVLPPPAPPFQGLGGIRDSIDSSAYSAASSARGSYASRASRASIPRNEPMSSGLGISKDPSPVAANGHHDSRVEEVKAYVEDQTAILVPTVQNLAQLVRVDADINQLMHEMNAITEVVGRIMSEVGSLGAGGAAALAEQLRDSRQRLVKAGDRGMDLAADGFESPSPEWRTWMQALPPIAFEIARDAGEVAQQLEQLSLRADSDDFA